MTEIPYGYCQCGCGQPAAIAQRSNRAKGHIKGRPTRFRQGHGAGKWQRPAVLYIEEPRGYETPCWTWQLATGRANGYGLMKRGRVTKGAHVRFWEAANGPVPEGLELDHLCRNRNCVRPDHLEPVTHAENVRRGVRDSPTWGRTHPTALYEAISADLRSGAFKASEIAARHQCTVRYVHRIARGTSGPKPRGVAA